MICWTDLNRLLRRVSITTLPALFMVGCAVSDGSRTGEVAPPSAPGSPMMYYNSFVASDPGGRVYVSFLGQAPDGRHGLYFTRSVDAGQTWLTEPVGIEAAQPPRRRIGFHRVESDGQGNVYVLWSTESTSYGAAWRPVEVRRRHSRDYGATWSEAPIVWTPDRAISYPVARTGKDGELHIVYTVEGKDHAGLFFTRTVQGGTAWLPSPIRIDHPQPESSPQEPGSAPQLRQPAWPAVAHNAAGHIFVAWQEKRGPTEAIYFNRSLDQGATWSQEDIRLDHSTTKGSVARIPVLRTDNQGTIYAAWEDSRHGRLDIFLNRSLDQGATWLTQDVRVSSNRPEQGNAWNPLVAGDGRGRIYVLWQEATRDSEGLSFRQSLDRGTTWASQPNVLVSRGRDTRLRGTLLAADADGHVYVAWRENARKKQTIFFSRSSDQGESWLSPYPSMNSEVATNDIRWPRMSADGAGAIYVVWTGNKTGQFKLFMNRSIDHGKTWLSQEVQVTG